MRSPILTLVGALMALSGTVFFFQGIGVIHGSTMTGTVTWSVLGPIIALAGIGLLYRGRRNTDRT